MQRSLMRITLFTLLVVVLSGCSWLTSNNNSEHFLRPDEFEKSPKKQWVNSSGSGNGRYLRLNPKLRDGEVITTNSKGLVVAVDAEKGKNHWRKNTKLPISTGPAVTATKIFFATDNGKLVALEREAGVTLWEAELPNQVLGTPGLTDSQVIVKTIDDVLLAFDSDSGKELWRYGVASPRLMLRESSAPAISGAYVVAGFANGQIAVLDAAEGTLVWQRQVAEASGFSDLERMVGINADPLVSQGVVFVTTYQGKIAAFGVAKGELLWEHELSAHAGLQLAGNQIIAPDSDGYLWSFDRYSGRVNWRQNGLKGRQLTQPVLVNGALVVADDKGFVYWLDPDDGHFSAWTFLSNDGVISAPIAAGDKVIIETRAGHLVALSAESINQEQSSST